MLPRLAFRLLRRPQHASTYATQGRRSQFAILTSVQPLVSIVVPVFNGLPHLRQLTTCLLGQTYPNLEFVFTEGGGSDASFAYLSSIDDSRIRLIQMPQETSAAGNWTAATMQARGEFTKLICQDDLLYPEAVQHQVVDLGDNPNAVMAIAQRDIVDARGRILFRRRGLAGLPAQSNIVRGDDVMRACYLQGTNVIGEPLAVLFRTNELQEAMPWDDTDPLMLDLSTYQKIAPYGDVALRHESIGAFRVSDTSWSTRIASEQLDQTKRWQDSFANSQSPPPGLGDRARALLGRHISTNLRRFAYTSLRIRGRLTPPETPR